MTSVVDQFPLLARALKAGENPERFLLKHPPVASSRTRQNLGHSPLTVIKMLHLRWPDMTRAAAVCSARSSIGRRRQIDAEHNTAHIVPLLMRVIVLAPYVCSGAVVVASGTHLAVSRQNRSPMAPNPRMVPRAPVPCAAGRGLMQSPATPARPLRTAPP